MYSTPVSLPEHEVHLWYFQIDYALDSAEEKALHYLDVQEWERYQRYVCPNKRQQFLISRILLKQLLSRYVGKPFETLTLRYSPLQKPFLEEPVQFNISHSGKYILIGVARHAIGIDIQEEGAVREEHVVLGLSPQEQQQVSAAVLYPYWVLREALWKAHNQEIRVTALLNAFPFDQARNSCSFLVTLDSYCASYLRLSKNLHIGWVVNHPQPVLRFKAMHTFSYDTIITADLNKFFHTPYAIIPFFKRTK